MRSSAALRSNGWRDALPFPRAHGREGTRVLWPRHDYERELGVQSRTSRRPVSWNCARLAAGASLGRRLQHKEDQHRTAGILLAGFRDAIQRKLDSVQLGSDKPSGPGREWGIELTGAAALRAAQSA